MNSPFLCWLTEIEKTEVLTNCDRLERLKFSPQLTAAFTENGAMMAAMVLNSPKATAMSVFVVRAFVRMREQLVANTAILKRLAEIDKTLLEHGQGLGVTWEQLQPQFAPPPDPPKRRIGFDQDPG